MEVKNVVFETVFISLRRLKGNVDEEESDN